MHSHTIESTKPINLDNSSKFARCIEVSKRVSWEIDRDVIRGRVFDFSQKFLPDGLTLVDTLDFLTPEQRIWLSQIQGRTYALMFGLVERFINAKVLETTRDYWLDDQIALEALIRFSDEELKHQELFRRIEALAASEMPEGYKFRVDPNNLAGAVLSKSSWAVMALILHIELFTQLHYQESIGGDDLLSPLYKDVFLFHWKEESQHAIMDEIEWRRLDAQITSEERKQGAEDFIGLVLAFDDILQVQAGDDCRYFCSTLGTCVSVEQRKTLNTRLLEAYRWQYILSGARHRHFVKVLSELVADEELVAKVFSAVDTLAVDRSA